MYSDKTKREEENVIARIFEEEDFNGNIVLYNEQDKPEEFEQVAVIYLEDDSYCILHPVVPYEGVDPDTGLVFRLDESEEEPRLVLVVDEKIIDEVFDEYDRLYEEAQKNN